MYGQDVSSKPNDALAQLKNRDGRAASHDID
jgi:hypothetical protein